MEPDRTYERYLKARKRYGSLSDWFLGPCYLHAPTRMCDRLRAGGSRKSSTESSAEPKPKAAPQPADQQQKKKNKGKPPVRSNDKLVYPQEPKDTMKKKKMRESPSQSIRSNSIRSNRSASAGSQEAPRPHLDSFIDGNVGAGSKTIIVNSQECIECRDIPKIKSELFSIKKELERNIKSEAKQKEQLNAINEQLKQLCQQIMVLNENCKSEKDISGDEKSDEKSVPLRKNMAVKFKSSSLCQFCKDTDLPVVDNLQMALLKIIGTRSYQDLVMHVLLRADNVYHVNVKDLLTGGVLGCLLVNERGIRTAKKRGLFRKILTFCVIDVRSTNKSRDDHFGSISFEYVGRLRLAGGREGYLFTPEQKDAKRKLIYLDFLSSATPVNSQEDDATDLAKRACDDFSISDFSESDSFSDVTLVETQRERKSGKKNTSEFLGNIKDDSREIGVASKTTHSSSDEAKGKYHSLKFLRS